MVFNNVQMEKRKRKVQRMEEFKVKNAEVRQTAKKLKIDAVSMAEKSKEDHQKTLQEFGSCNNLYHDMKREIMINPMECFWFKSN